MYQPVSLAKSSRASHFRLAKTQLSSRLCGRLHANQSRLSFANSSLLSNAFCVAPAAAPNPNNETEFDES